MHLEVALLALFGESDFLLAQLALVSVHQHHHFAQASETLLFEVHFILPEITGDVHPLELILGVFLLRLLHESSHTGTEKTLLVLASLETQVALPGIGDFGDANAEVVCCDSALGTFQKEKIRAFTLELADDARR